MHWASNPPRKIKHIIGNVNKTPKRFKKNERTGLRGVRWTDSGIQPLQNQIYKIRRHDVVMVVGDVNAKVGSDNEGYEACKE